MSSTSPRSEPARQAAIYTRISQDALGDELGVQRQQRLCRELAMKLGWDVVEVYQDDNLSAFKRRRRPAFERLLEDIRIGRINAIVVYNPDRLSRDDLRGLEALIDLLNAHGVEVQTVHSGEFDLSTSTGRGHARMAGVFARMESEKMSERLIDKHAELVEQGMPPGGTRPFGYQRIGAKTYEGDTRQFVPHPDEAPVVAELVERVARGETMTRIAEDLNERGIVTSKGAAWTINTVRRVALNPVYAGLRTHRGVETGPGTWQAIVNEDTWRRAAGVLTDPSRPKRRAARRYLLSGGLLVCGKCGGPMLSKPHRDGKNGDRTTPRYVCYPSTKGGCGGTSVRAEHVEELVTEWVFARVEAPQFGHHLAAQRGADSAAAADVRSLEAQLDHLADQLGAGKMTEREWQRVRAGVVKRLDEARGAVTVDTSVAAVGRYAGRRGALRDDWPTMSLDLRQSIVRSLIETIAIAPVERGRANPFDPSRVGTPVWKV